LVPWNWSSNWPSSGNSLLEIRVFLERESRPFRIVNGPIPLVPDWATIMIHGKLGGISPAVDIHSLGPEIVPQCNRPPIEKLQVFPRA
jgi:hypothetical protein